MFMSKELVMQVLNELPDTFSVEDFFEILYLRLKSQEALNDVKKGEVLRVEELKKEIMEWK